MIEHSQLHFYFKKIFTQSIFFVVQFEVLCDKCLPFIPGISAVLLLLYALLCLLAKIHAEKWNTMYIPVL